MFLARLPKSRFTAENYRCPGIQSVLFLLSGNKTTLDGRTASFSFPSVVVALNTFRHSNFGNSSTDYERLKAQICCEN